MSDEHQAFIKTPRQLITVVILAFVVPILTIILLATFVGRGSKPAAGNAASLAPEAAEARIRPVAGFELRDASGPAVLRSGEQVVKGQCAACHETGAAGAPKLGDAGAWAARIKTGYDALLAAALKGKGAMPAQSGGEYVDAEIGRAVAYMANQAGAKFEEPKAAAPAKAEDKPAPAAAAPAAPAPMAAAPAAAAAAPAAAAAAAAPAAGGAGKALYDSACMACHATGAANAPKLGDKAAWAPRLAQGVPALVTSAIKGKGAMPPKGGSAASDADIHSAVVYMVSAAK